MLLNLWSGIKKLYSSYWKSAEEFGNGFNVTIFRKVSNASEKVSNAFERYIIVLEKEKVTDTFMRNIEQVFGKCGIGVPFGQANVMEWLDCSKSKATNIMKVMKKAKVIKKVTVLGPGKYEFVEV